MLWDVGFGGMDARRILAPRVFTEPCPSYGPSLLVGLHEFLKATQLYFAWVLGGFGFAGGIYKEVST